VRRRTVAREQQGERASARPIPVAAKASPSVSTVNRPRLVSPYWAWGSEIAQDQTGIERYARTILAAVIAASPSVKPAIEVSPSQARFFPDDEDEERGGHRHAP
jgi:hypothetical protein